MSNPTNPDDPRRQRLDEVIGEFLVAVDAGQNPNPREWLARHSDLHPELADFFADRNQVDVLIEPLKAAPADRGGDPNVPTAAGQSTASGSSPQMSLTGTELASDDTTGESSGERSDPRPSGIRVRYFGDYELQHVLGEGGMGIVYKARQLSLNRAVALKMITAARFAGAEEVRRFQNESEAIARLDHPNIVPIFEVGQFEDQHYFSMKLIGGESLDKRLKDYTDHPRRAAKLVKVVVGAVHHAAPAGHPASRSERSGHLRGNACEGRRGGDQVVGVAAVERDASHLHAGLAGEVVAAAAVVAGGAVPGVPPDADALAGLPPLRDVLARGVDHADHLVPRDAREGDAGPKAPPWSSRRCGRCRRRAP